MRAYRYQTRRGPVYFVARRDPKLMMYDEEDLTLNFRQGQPLTTHPVGIVSHCLMAYI